MRGARPQAERDQLTHDVDRKVSAPDVSIFVRKNCLELLFAKVWQPLLGSKMAVGPQDLHCDLGLEAAPDNRGIARWRD